MAASYPSSVKVFTTHVNITEVIDAGHPNTIQDEVVAIESTLGVTPNLSTTPSPSGTFTATSTSFANVSARLANIETGVVSDAHTQYIRKTADASNVITAPSASTVPLVVKGASSQSANLLEFKNSSNSTIAYIDAAGAFSGSISLPDISINAQTGTTYTLGLSDKNKLVTLTNASPITLTVPLNSSVAFPVGSQISIAQFGAGQVTVAGAVGVTVNATPGLKLRTTSAGATLIKVGTDTWWLSGDLSA